MKIRAPLYAKIFLWFLLNLALVGAIIYAFVGTQFHLGLDSLLAGRAGDRIGAVADVIVAELRNSPRQNWDAILQRFSEAYHVQFSLFQNEGTQLAGARLELPAPVRARLAGAGPNDPSRPFPGGPFFPEGPPLRGPQDQGPPGGMQPPPPRREPPVRGHPKEMVHTGNPSRYWVLLRMPLAAPGIPPGMPTTFVTMSDSLNGGGLFFEFKPWLAVAVAALLVSVVCWLPFVSGVTRAISRLTAATGRIAEGRFDVRVPENRNDELGSLAHAVNGMATRLDGFVTGQKRFLGDIAHELCAPIARIQVALGILEQRAGENEQASVGDLREEVDHMSTLVNELLSFSKASLASSAIKLQSVALLPLVEKAIHRESANGANFETHIPAGMSAQADPDLLLRALSNLLRNAVRYAGDAGPIAISATREGAGVALSVGDCGPGVSEDALAKIFDPFYRVDASRDRETGGVGLGLAIVKTCVESCGGSVSCKRRAPSGLEVTLNLR